MMLWSEAVLVRFGLFAAVVVGRAANSKNPFDGQTFYVNPANSEEYDGSIATSTGIVKDNLQRMRQVPSAYWIDVKEKIRGADTRSLEGILKDASSKSPPELVTLIWYDLPNRDCDAKASNGQICCYTKADGTCDYEKTGSCSAGIDEYKSQYADPFVEVLKEYQDKLPIVLILEPDSLPNLATNSGHPHCGNPATQAAYFHGIKYAMEKLITETPSVTVYLDAAHGGWLGWENNLEKFMGLLKKIQLPMDHIRGFATNVANYQPLGIQCPFCPDQGFRNAYCLNGRHSSDPCCADPCKLLSQYSAGNNELNYAADLVAASKALLGMKEAHVVIDTGRSGVTDMRSTCQNWCNPRDAGAGVPSTTDVANKSLVDAYFWLKTPGESDGCSQTLPNGEACTRFDSMCGSIDSIGTKDAEPPAPEAGKWFDYQVKQLAGNAHFEQEGISGDNLNQSACPVGMGRQQQHQQQPQLVQSIWGGQQQHHRQSVQSVWEGQLQQEIHQQQGQPHPELQSPQQAGGSFSPPLLPTDAAAGGVVSNSCAKAYQQCGGKVWQGATCCESGCKCIGGEYYMQCQPPAGLYTCSASSFPAEMQHLRQQSNKSHSQQQQQHQQHKTMQPTAQPIHSTAQSTRSIPQPQQPHSASFAPGDRVTWISHDADVPQGAVGVVMRLLEGGVAVKFPKGSWGFRVDQLRKAAGREVGSGTTTPPTSYSTLTIATRAATVTTPALAFAAGDRVMWTREDKDVPRGSVGVVERVVTTGVDRGLVVNFPNGRWGFEADQMKKIIAADSSAHNFCCIKALDSSDPCGSCHANGIAGVGTWCGSSRDNCHSCGQESTWCPSANTSSSVYIRKDLIQSDGLVSDLIAQPTRPVYRSAIVVASVMIMTPIALIGLLLISIVVYLHRRSRCVSPRRGPYALVFLPEQQAVQAAPEADALMA